MPPKRKGNIYTEKLQEMKKLRTEKNDEEDIQRGIDFEFKAENSTDLLKHLVKQATPDDIYCDYLYFVRNLPQLLNNQSTELIHLVRKELNIAEVQKNLGGKVNFKGDTFPILDALSCKIGTNLRNILAPPTIVCLLCERPLTVNNAPTQVPLHTLNGPQLATKYSWECRTCRGIGQFNINRNVNGDIIHCANKRVVYHVDMYGNSDLGYKMYPKKMGVKVVRASSMVYLTEKFLKSYIDELQHSFVSSEGKCESYNETFLDSEETQVFKTFLHFNPEVGRRFQSKNNHDGCSDKDEGEGLSQMHELGRKMLSAGFYNHQVYSEMVDRGLVETEIFGPRINPSNSRQKLTYQDTLEHFMQKVDELSRNELYEHTENDCSKACKQRGCGNVATVDGLWKLTYKICMYEPKHNYPNEDIYEYLPNVCPEQPVSGSAFCKVHAEIVEKHGYSSKLRPFLEQCGANPSSYSAAGRQLVKSVLEDISKKNSEPDSSTTAGNVQGIRYLLRNKHLANKENFKTKEIDVGNKVPTKWWQQDGDCRKDIGEGTRLHRRF